MDLKSQLKTSLERNHHNPPPGLDVAELVHAGRGAVRRRRLAAMSLTAVIVAGSAGMWQIAVDDDPAAPERAASSRADAAGEPPVLDPAELKVRDNPDLPAALTRDGRVILQEGVRVLDRVDDPIARADHSVALELKNKSERLFFLADTDKQGNGGSFWSNVGEPYENLETWVAANATAKLGSPARSDGFAIRNDVSPEDGADTPGEDR